MLPEEAIKEYQELYLKIFGVVLTDSEAAIKANNLVQLYTSLKKATIKDPVQL